MTQSDVVQKPPLYAPWGKSGLVSIDIVRSSDLTHYQALLSNKNLRDQKDKALLAVPMPLQPAPLQPAPEELKGASTSANP